MWVLLIWLVLVTVMWVRWNHITYAPLGRLFFQVNAAIAALLGYALVRLTSLAVAKPTLKLLVVT